MYPSLQATATSGIHLAYSRSAGPAPQPAGTALYRVAAVAAALLLVITVF